MTISSACFALARSSPCGRGPPATRSRPRLALDVPRFFSPERSARVRWTVSNLDGATLMSAGVHPVRLSWRWWDSGRHQLLSEGERVNLLDTLPPGTKASGTAYLQPPAGYDTVQLRASHVQESCAGSTMSIPSTAFAPPSDAPSRTSHDDLSGGRSRR